MDLRDSGHFDAFEDFVSNELLPDGPFRNAFEYAAIGMVLSDLDGRCLAANRAFCQMVGYTAAELQHLQFSALTHPDDLARNLEAGRAMIAGVTPTFTIEKRYIHKDGHAIWTLLSASAVRDRDGLPLYIISQIQDITEQKAAEDALRRSEGHQRALLNALPDFAFHFSAEGVLLGYQGPASIRLALPDEQLLNRPLRDIVPPDLIEPLEQAMADAQATRTTQVVNVTYPVRGTLEHFEVRLSSMGAQGVLAVARKISDQVRAEQAEREQRALSDALLDTAEALNSTLNLDELLDRILENVLSVVPCEVANILLVQPDGQAQVVRRRSSSDDMLTVLEERQLHFSLTGTTTLRRMADTGRPLIVTDVRAWPGWITLPGQEWIASYLGVPMYTRRELLGFISVLSAQPDHFKPLQAERLQALAHQATSAIENARLFQAEREQSDVAESLRDTAAALNSTLQLDEVLDRILANTSRVVPYDAINIMLIDRAARTLRVIRHLGYAERGLEKWITQLELPITSAIGYQFMADTGEIYVVSDTHAHPSWKHFHETTWQRSYIGVPFKIDGQVIGFLNLDSATAGFYTFDHAARLRAFADQVALAFRNARLFEATRRHVQQLNQTHQGAVEMARASTLPQFYGQLLRTARRLVDAQAAALTLYDGRRELILTAVENLPPDLLGERLTLGLGLSGQAAKTRTVQQATVVGTPANGGVFAGQLPGGSAIALPLMWQDRLVGTLDIGDARQRVFDADDIHVLTLFATLAAAAVEQRRAMTEAETREAEARLLGTRLTTAQEEERTRIAALLHDAIGNQLATIQRNVEQLQASLNGADVEQLLEANLDLLKQAQMLTRTLAADLDSKTLDDVGLAAAIRQQIDRVRTTTGLKITMHVTGHVRRIAPDIERLMFRGFQEALTNALRHSRATEVEILLNMGAHLLRLTVHDNGQGFAPASAPRGTNLGLPHIQRQVEALHGEFVLESSANFGTLVALQLPLLPATYDGPTRPRVFIVDDHEATRQGLRQIIVDTNQFVCVGEASDSPFALEQVERLRPDLVFIDIRLPQGNGLDLTRQVLRRLTQTRVIIFTNFADESYLQQALAAGAKGYLLKSEGSYTIGLAMQAVLAGETFVSTSLAEHWARIKDRPVNTTPIGLLSDREIQVLRLVAAGQRSDDIAQHLGISTRTVEVHRRNIMEKLDIKNRAHLIQFALQHGLT